MIIKDRSLKLIFVICLITAIIFPLINIMYIYPSFSELLKSNIEVNAVRTGNHLATMIRKYDDEFTNKVLSDDFLFDINEMIDDNNLLKIKIFNASGNTIYSTNSQDIGKKHTGPAFYEIVTHGRPYTKIMSRGNKSLEGQAYDAHVAESYVPIMKRGKFIGAFELYYDINTIYNKLNKIVLVASLLPLGIMFIFLIVIVAVLIRTENKQELQFYSHKSLRYSSPYMSMAILIASLFFAEMVAMLIISNTPNISNQFSVFLDAVILTMIVTPIAYFFLIQPLIRYIKEHARIESALSESEKSLAEKHETLNNTFQQVQRSKIEWEKTLDSVGDMIILTNSDGKIKRVNKPVRDFVNRPYEEILNKDWEELIHDCELEAVSQYAGSIELVHAATHKWFSLNIYPFEEQSIDFSGNVITLHATTEIKHVSEKLMESNREIEKNRHKLQSALNEISSLIQIVTTNRDMSVRLENSTLKKCYEIKDCSNEKCPCYGKEPMRCWQIAGTFCGGEVQGTFAQKFGNCTECDVYKNSSADPIKHIGELFNNMMHVLEMKNNERDAAIAAMKERESCNLTGIH